MGSRTHLTRLAALFDYPDALFPERVRQAAAAIVDRYPAAAESLQRFAAALPCDDLIAMQELYTRTFDVQAITTLDLGYILFGDDYKRGELLANLRREHLAHGNDCGTELPDHLPNVLRLMALLDDDELLDELVVEIVAPALEQMIGEFDPARIRKKNDSYRKQYNVLIEQPNPGGNGATLYRFALQTVYTVLKADHKVVERIPLVAASDFLQSLSRENRLEDNAKPSY